MQYKLRIVPIGIELSRIRQYTTPIIKLLVNGKMSEFIGYRGGSQLRSDNIKFFHWGYDQIKGSYAAIEYGSGFPDSESGNNYCSQLLKVVCAVLDNPIFDQAVIDFKDNDVSSKTFSAQDIKSITLDSSNRSVFGHLLATLSDHYKCDKSLTGEEYKAARLQSREKRMNQPVPNSFAPDLGGVFGDKVA